MRIMLVTRVTHHHRPGGMPHVVQDRAEALAKLGHGVHVVTTGLNGPMYEEMIQSNVAYHCLAAPPQKWSREFAEECERWFKHLRPDILHFDSFDRSRMWFDRASVTMHGFGWGAFLTKWNMARVMGANTTHVPFDVYDLAEEAKALRKFRTVLGVSLHEARMLRDEYGLPNVKHVYNPISEYFFLWPEVVGNFLRPGRPLCECCGGTMEYCPCGLSCRVCDNGSVRVDRSKASYFMCAAVSGQQERGFNIAQEACKRAGVDFKIVGRQRRRDMPIIYDGAKALLLPTFYAQGFDLAVCEARARGVPCVMTPTGSYLAEALPHDILAEPTVEAYEKVLREWADRHVDPECAEVHRPRYHAEKWLEAVTS